MNFATKGDSFWLVDSGATNYVTSDFNNLKLNHDYDGNDSLVIGDGSRLPATYTGSTSINSSNVSFKLDDILCVLKAKII